MRKLIAITLAVSAIRPSISAAQRDARAGERAAARRLAFAVTEQPDATSPFSLTKPKLSLEATKEAQKVVGSIGLAFTQATLDLTFSGPIGEDDEEASPLTLDGLVNGAFVQVGFTGSSAIKRNLTARDVDAIDGFCDRLIPGDDCDATAMTSADRARFLRLFMRKLPLYYGAHVKLGSNEFSYTTDAALATDVSEKHNAVAVVASLGVLTPQLWFIAGHLEGQRYYNAAGGPQQLCVPFGTAGATTCRTTTVGRPTKSTETIATLEGRRIFVGRSVGLNPTFRYALEEKTTTVEMPVYFFQEKADALKDPVPSLNGGVSFGWHSDKGFQMRAFVGVAVG